MDGKRLERPPRTGDPGSSGPGLPRQTVGRTRKPPVSIPLGALTTSCISCLPLLLTSLLALEAPFGIGTLRLATTPLDPALDVVEVPLLLLSAAIAWATWPGPRGAFALALFGSALALALARPLAMPHPGGYDHGDGHHGDASAASSGPLIGSVAPFSAGTGLVLAGLVWNWRSIRKRVEGTS